MTILGILGGGQLAQMLTQAAVSLGVQTAIFARREDTPASRLTQHNVVGDWADADLLARFAAMCDVVTLENEFVDAGVLRILEEQHRLPVYPSSKTLALIQDKLIQKQTIQAAGLPVPEFKQVEAAEDVLTFAQEHGFPLVLKARREGYDGYGNATLQSPQDIVPAFEKLNRAMLVEAFVPFVRELAVMVLRGHDGEMLAYPVVETIQRNHVCHVVRAPAQIQPDVATKAQALARGAVQAVEGVGVFGVEMFEMENGDVLYNEMAPRPHNSGHYTIEGCVTSQFENHIRAVLGWPLGSTDLVAPAAVMVNLLGEAQQDANPVPLNEALQVPGAHFHIYGKRQVRPGRKMGHVTVLGESIEEAEATAQRAAGLVGL